MILTQAEFNFIAQALSQPINPLDPNAIAHIQQVQMLIRKLSDAVERPEEREGLNEQVNVVGAM